MCIPKLVVFLSLFLSSSVFAICEQRKAIAFGGWSKHFISSQRSDGNPWNEKHELVGIECNRWSAFAFDNSWDKEAYALGYTIPLKENDLFGFGIYTALWTGYDDIVAGGVIPVVSPKVNIKVDRLTISGIVNPVVAAVYLSVDF